VKIEVRLFATLAAYLPDESDGRSATLGVADGTTVADVVRLLGIPDDMPFIAMIDGRDAALERPLGDGEALSLFPPLAGGQ